MVHTLWYICCGTYSRSHLKLSNTVFNIPFERRSPFSFTKTAFHHPAGPAFIETAFTNWPAHPAGPSFVSLQKALGVQQNGVQRSAKRRSAKRRSANGVPMGFQTALFDSTMPYSDYLKHRAIVLRERRLSSQTIVDLLAEEGLKATRQGIAQFLKRYATTCSIKRARGSGRRPKATLAVRTIVEAQMRTDDETTAKELRRILREKGHALSLSTILRCRRSLGWIFRGSSYCQMIREPNKAKRLEWALQYQAEAETGFLDVVYSDETSIQLETHKCFCCRKLGEPPRSKPR